MVTVELGSSYNAYLKYLLDIVELLNTEAYSQDTVSQDERNSVAELEKNYQQLSDELQSAKSAVQEQYRNVWESCVQSEGLRKAPDQRPAPTGLSWKEAVHIQELAASKIQMWFKIKTRQAILERENKIREEEAKKAALAAAQAEADRRKAEEAARLERERSEALVEAMKRKHRGNN